MIALPGSLKVFVASDAVSMKKSFDGLCVIVKEQLQQDALSGQLFVFFNKIRDKVKILYWDNDGFAIYYKRLERGRFRPPNINKKAYQLSMDELNMLLEGIELTHKYRRSLL